MKRNIDDEIEYLIGKVNSLRQLDDPNEIDVRIELEAMKDKLLKEFKESYK